MKKIRYYLLIPATFIGIAAATYYLNVASMKSGWAGVAACGFLLLIWLYTRLLKWVFKGSTKWLEDIAAEKHLALKEGRIYIKPTPTTKTEDTAPPPAPKAPRNFHEPEGEE